MTKTPPVPHFGGASGGGDVVPTLDNPPPITPFSPYDKTLPKSFQPTISYDPISESLLGPFDSVKKILTPRGPIVSVTYRDHIDGKSIIAISERPNWLPLDSRSACFDLKEFIATPKSVHKPRARGPSPSRAGPIPFPRDNPNRVVGWEILDSIELKELREKNISQSPARRNKKETRRRNYLRRQRLSSCGGTHSAPLTRITNSDDNDDSPQESEVEIDNSSPEWMSFLESFRKSVDPSALKYFDRAIFHVENFALLAYGLSRATSLFDCAHHLICFVKFYNQDSIFLTFKRLVTESIGTDHTTRLTANGFSTSDCINLLKNNKNFDKLAYLIGAAFSISACKLANVEWDLPFFNQISKHASAETVNAVDFIDAFSKMFAWVSDVGVKCFQQRSLMPILFSSDDVQTLCGVYFKWKPRIPSVLAGNCSSVSEEQELEKEFRDLLVPLQRCLKMQPKGSTLSLLTNTFNEVSSTLHALENKRKGASFRIASLGLCLFGGTAVGKSTIVPKIFQAAFKGMSIEYSKDYIAPINTKDDFQNLVDSSTLGVILDDVNQTKAAFVKNNPNDLILSLVNNIPTPVIKAELELKSSCWFQHKVTVMTSQVLGFRAEDFSIDPMALYRRFLHIEMEVRPEYRKKGTMMLDDENKKLTTDNPDLTVDAWLFTVYYPQSCIIRQGKPGKKPKVSTHWEVIDFEWKGEIMPASKIDVYMLEYLIVTRARSHIANQLDLEKSQTAMSPISGCAVCLYPDGHCICKDGVSKVFPAPPVKKVCTEISAPKAIESDSESSDDESESGSVVSSKSSKSRLSACAGPVDEIVSYAGRTLYNSVSRWFTMAYWAKLLRVHRSIGKMLDKEIVEELNNVVDSAITHGVVVFPDFIWDTPIVQRAVKLFVAHRAAADQMLVDRSTLLRRTFAISSLVVGSIFLAFRKHPKRFHAAICGGVFTGVSTAFSLSAKSYVGYTARKRKLEKMLMDRRIQHKSLVKYAKENPAESITIAVGLLGLVSLGVSCWNSNRLSASAGTLDNDPERETSMFSWLGKIPFPKARIPQPARMVQASPTQATNTLKNCVLEAFFTQDDDPTRYRAQFVCLENGYVLMNAHYFNKGAVFANQKVSRIKGYCVQNSNSVFGRMYFDFALSSGERFENFDLLMFRMSHSRNFKDHTRLLPTEHGAGNLKARILGYNAGKFHELVTTAEHCECLNGLAKRAIKCYAPNLIDPGTCMSILLSERNNPAILGFLYASWRNPDDPDYQEGYVFNQQILYSDYVMVRKKLEERFSKHSLFPCAGKIPTELYGKKIYTPGPGHPQMKILDSAPENCQIRIRGQTPLQATYTSNVRKLPISESVARVMGRPCLWGKPYLNPPWRAYNATMVHMMDPPYPYPSDLVNMAFDDFVEPFPRAMALFIARVGRLSPLNRHDTVNGIRGVSTVNGMVFNTSRGIPLRGLKLLSANQLVGDNGELYYEVDIEIWDVVDQMIETYRKNERCFPVFSTSLKDEATLLMKNGEKNLKVRCFQASPMAFTLLVRMYYMPIIRFIRAHPELCENAVGINCGGPDWSRMTDSMFKYGEDNRGVGIDWSKWDVRQDFSLSCASHSVFVYLAQLGGYTDDDIVVMRGIAADMLSPVLDWNGTLIECDSIFPSGVPITVDLNGVQNSLHNRVHYFATGLREPFRNNVSQYCVGDDNEKTVRKKIRSKYNFLFQQQYAARYGYKITPADKDGTAQADWPLSELDFLKRKNSFIPEIGMSLGALAEDSMIKALHVGMNPKPLKASDGTLIPQDLSDTARNALLMFAHEAFNHGRDFYEANMPGIRKIAEEHGLEEDFLYKTFDTRVEDWKSDYQSS
jgi:hypothetical protein